MAAPPTTVTTPPVTVTVAPAAPSASMTATPTSLTPAGGVVVLAGATNLPDGTAFELFLNGTDTGQSASSVSGAFSFSYTVPPNTTLNSETDTFTATAQYTPPAAPAPSA